MSLVLMLASHPGSMMVLIRRRKNSPSLAARTDRLSMLTSWKELRTFLSSSATDSKLRSSRAVSRMLAVVVRPTMLTSSPSVRGVSRRSRSSRSSITRSDNSRLKVCVSASEFRAHSATHSAFFARSASRASEASAAANLSRSCCISSTLPVIALRPAWRTRHWAPSSLCMVNMLLYFSETEANSALSSRTEDSDSSRATLVACSAFSNSSSICLKSFASCVVLSESLRALEI
mmetsp:Transcript_30903/g.66490  ORF Transcript_30903/g.66490 Transcript_30903/m.66490 type:complete len:233 (+) Transcript_30903:866-1564(+)